MTGLDGLLYMSSTSDASGNVSITLTFASGTNPDIAQVQVQNKLQVATVLLPAIVQQQGITVTKSASGFLMVVGLRLRRRHAERVDMADYAASNMVEPLSRVPGVGAAQLFGAQVRHAHLARRRPAQGVQRDAGRRDQRRQRSERAALGSASSAARRRSPASSSTRASRPTGGCRPPRNSGASCCARCRRLAATTRRRGSRRARQRRLQLRVALQRPAGRGYRHLARGRRQRARRPRRASRRCSTKMEPSLPARAAGRHSRRHDAVRARLDPRGA